ncbi:MAG: phosphoenolpyruvate synthase [Paludibacteraceae bacterium]|nr:phosphoenolpyruvate synthase [Paludibacteraceae bacterium]
MAIRIRRILLVCNNYDSFVLNEDGRIDVQIAQEYAELNLSNPPAIVRTETTDDALQLMRNGEQFSLVIMVNNAAVEQTGAFARQMKQLAPDTPIVLLTSFSKTVYERVRTAIVQNDDDEREHTLFTSQYIDYIFCWNNSADLIIAIIKLLEDKLNADHDILGEEVRAILLVEDSIRYYSTYLPVLYKLVLQQNSIAIKDALNEQQQLFRKRARPKILMATCYDEAVELYRKYRKQIIGVISDIGFVIHKTDLPEKEKLDAGVDLCKLIRKDIPTMPILMQSSQDSMREVAAKLNVGFIVKTSKTLTQQLGDYIGREFGFGDFVAIDPDTDKEIMRANDLEGFERIISTIPPKAFRRLSDNNYLSKWLYARGLFSVARGVRKLKIQNDDDIENVRRQNIQLIHDYRLNQAQGVVAKFNPDTFNDTIWFSRLGNSSLGGKARGLAFLNSILYKYNLYDRWDNVRVLVPRTLVITTEFFDRFIHDNGLQYIIESELSDEEILAEFVASTLPQELIEALRMFVRVSGKPVAVRSSSKLEDSYYQPFAGVYSTYMIPATENEDQQIRMIGKAVKSVYAAVYFASARGYIASTANLISEEKMAVVIQEICGEEQGTVFFPTLSGVARSINFYPVGYETPDDGIVKVAYGLGKVVVDGEQVLRFAPDYPNHVLQTSTPELTMRDTQQSMLALSMQPELFKTSVNDDVNLKRFNISDCEQFYSLRHVASTFDYDNQRIVDSCYPHGPRFITFAPMLKFNTFPLADILKQLLLIAKQEMKCPVEIEFAANIPADNSKAVFNVLQIRPIATDTLYAKVDWTNIDQTNPLILSDMALGIGKIDGVSDIIYLKQSAFDPLRTTEMAETIREWNTQLRLQGKTYLLIGFGRWGSQIPSLGVPVQWSDISEAKAIVECSLPNFRVEPSQGSHFFQNLTSFNVGYINVDPYARANDSYNEQQLNRLDALHETSFLRHVQLPKPLQITIDGLHNHACIKL